MFVLGVVGHAQEKFTSETEHLAREAIRSVIKDVRPQALCSGHSPMGGVDIYAEEIANELGLGMIVHAPTRLSWSGKGGYMDRNMAIARDSNLVLCVVVRKLPKDYRGMRFNGCYHCKARNAQHVKSGGCWTAWRCKEHVWRIV